MWTVLLSGDEKEIEYLVKHASGPSLLFEKSKDGVRLRSPLFSNRQDCPAPGAEIRRVLTVLNGMLKYFRYSTGSLAAEAIYGLDTEGNIVSRVVQVPGRIKISCDDGETITVSE